MSSFIHGRTSIKHLLVEEGVHLASKGTVAFVSEELLRHMMQHLGHFFPTDNVGTHDEAPVMFGTMTAWAVTLVCTAAVVVLWLMMVRVRRPASPQEAMSFRKRWLLTVLSLGAAILSLFYIISMSAWGNDLVRLSTGGKIGLAVSCVSAGFILFAIVTLLFSPPTVVTAVPGGALYARLRWR